jgi:thiol-disulfide isomerase/thioredoxin
MMVGRELSKEGPMISTHLATLLLAVAGVGDDTVLLDFYADWCGPCRTMEPVVSQLISAGHPIRRVNVSQDRQLAARYRVTSIPCYVLLVNGQEVDRLVGASGAGELEALLAKARLEPTASRTSGPQSPGQPPDPMTNPNGISGIRPVSLGPGGSAGVPTPPAAHGPPAAIASRGRILEASVRLTIEDRDGFSYGSGTIIDARQGEALILTCGHIFRDSQGKGKILVDVFGPQSVSKLEGSIVSYDLARDVGLISIRPRVPVTVARVAPPGHRLLPGDRVTSIGCDHGAAPTPRDSKVTSLNKFAGPKNVEVAGQPVQGRSGGGLFDSEGYVVGVCNAADPADNEGLFAATETIHAQLDQAHLSVVYQTLPGQDGGALAGGRSGAAGPDRSVASGLTADELRQAAALSQMSAADRAALGPIKVGAQPAEVICIVRSLGDPKAKPEMFVLDRASQTFLEQLAAERQTQGPRQLTSINVRRAPGPACDVDPAGAPSAPH